MSNAIAAPRTVPQVQTAIEVLQAMQGNGLEFVDWGNTGFRPITQVIEQLHDIWGISAPKGKKC